MAYPQPAKSNTLWFAYTVAEPGEVMISIYNVAGELVESLPDSAPQPGTHRRAWNIAKVAPGIYFYRLKATGKNQQQDFGVKKIAIVSKTK